MGLEVLTEVPGQMPCNVDGARAAMGRWLLGWGTYLGAVHQLSCGLEALCCVRGDFQAVAEAEWVWGTYLEFQVVLHVVWGGRV